ncbi:hypothetical protein D9757_014107 [Collybiopsis confluens]|uniref:SnoaL-like domain-containing protein n=1 Tax=Collybiopsis confluens TaxID=2823264 RepID=A0A8H5FP19_9AGAR|nr:hypothetical protein D9757_014107 [Collybiopsis confluens]
MAKNSCHKTKRKAGMVAASTVSERQKRTSLCMSEMFEACDRLDVNGIIGLFSEDASFTFGGLATLETKPNIAESMRSMFANYSKMNHEYSERLFPPPTSPTEPVPTAVIFASDHVVALGTILYTVKNGEEVSVKVCAVVQSRQRQDKSCELIRVELYGDFGALMQAISSLNTEHPQEFLS